MESKGNSTVSSDQKTNEKTFASSATMKPHGKSTAASAIAAKPNGKSDVPSDIPKKQKSDFLRLSYNLDIANKITAEVVTKPEPVTLEELYSYIKQETTKGVGDESGPSTSFEHSAGDRVRKSSESLESLEAKRSKSG
ncbi:hypothetical protein YC2023_013397 [Brassica napus]